MYLQEQSFAQRGKHAAILLTQTMLPSLGYTSYKLEENQKEKHNKTESNIRTFFLKTTFATPNSARFSDTGTPFWILNFTDNLTI